MAGITKEYFDKRFEELLGILSKSFDNVERRLGSVEERMDGMESELKKVRRVVEREETESDTLREDVRRLSEVVVTNHEPRIANLEAELRP